MAVGDEVILRYEQDYTGDTYWHTKGPLVGVVMAETVGPPDTADVQWRNGAQTTVVQSDLYKLFRGGSERAFIGKWAQIASYYADLPNINELPKSPAGAGMVHEAYAISAYGLPSADAAFAVVSVHDGRGRLLVGCPSDNAPTAWNNVTAGNLHIQPRKLVRQQGLSI